MSQLGRIGGQVLTDNLLRAGVDLAFETDLLYLDVNNQQIGIKDSTPVYTLDVNNNIYTNDLTAVTQLAPGNLRLNSPETITTSVGGIDVYINGRFFTRKLINTPTDVIEISIPAHLNQSLSKIERITNTPIKPNVLEIELRYLDATTPKEIGLGSDGRKLAIALETAIFQ
jgi:hypothetical protein